MMYTMTSYFLLSTYYVPDTVLSALHVLFNFYISCKSITDNRAQPRECGMQPHMTEMPTRTGWGSFWKLESGYDTTNPHNSSY